MNVEPRSLRPPHVSTRAWRSRAISLPMALLALLALSPGLARAEADPRAPAPRWELTGSAAGLARSYEMALPYPDLVPDQRLLQRDVVGALDAAYFLTPLRDSDAPRSLLPFLQRTSVVYLGAGAVASEFRASDPYGFEPERVTNSSRLFVRSGIDAYVLPSLALTGRADYTYGVTPATSTSYQEVSGSVGLGVRVGDSRLDLRYSLLVPVFQGTAVTPIRWGTLGLTEQVVLAKRVSLRASGELLHHGAHGGAELWYYPTNQLGISAGGFAGRAAYYWSSELVRDRFGGSTGASVWVAPSVKVSASYELTFEKPDKDPRIFLFDSHTHVVNVRVSVRL